MKKEKEILQRELKNLKKTFDFMNSHLLKGVATMAELTKTDAREPLGKIKPTDKMVMMLGLLMAQNQKHQNSIMRNLICT